MVYTSQGGTSTISSSVYLKDNSSLDGNGATLVMTAFDTFIRSAGDGVPLQSTVITANPTAGTNTVQVTSVSGISVGQRVALRLGDNSYDNFESPIYTLTAVVTAINGLTLTLDRIIPYTINVIGATNHKHVDSFASFVHDVRIRDLFLEGSGSTVIDGGCLLYWSRNVVFDRIVVNKDGGLNFGYGFFLEYCENVAFRDIVIYHNRNTGGQSSFGRLFNFAACRDVFVRGAIAEDLHDNFVFAEDYCDNLNFQDVTIRHSNNPTNQVLFACVISRMYVENLRVEMPNPYDVISYGSTLADPFTKARFKNISMLGSLPRVMPEWPDVSGRISFASGADRFDIDLDAQVEKTLTITLSAGMNTNFQFAPGHLLTVSINAAVSTLSAIGAVYLGTTSNNGANITSSLVANTWVEITPDGGGGLLGSGGNMYGTVARILDGQAKLLVQTDTDPGGTLQLIYHVAPYL
jgi:hypothetical protein